MLPKNLNGLYFSVLSNVTCYLIIVSFICFFTFGNKVMKILHYLCSHFARQDEHNGRRPEKNKATQIPKTKKQKYGMNKKNATIILRQYLPKPAIVTSTSKWSHGATLHPPKTTIIMCVLLLEFCINKEASNNRTSLSDSNLITVLTTQKKEVPPLT